MAAEAQAAREPAAARRAADDETEVEQTLRTYLPHIRKHLHESLLGRFRDDAHETRLREAELDDSARAQRRIEEIRLAEARRSLEQEYLRRRARELHAARLEAERAAREEARSRALALAATPLPAAVRRVAAPAEPTSPPGRQLDLAQWIAGVSPAVALTAEPLDAERRVFRVGDSCFLHLDDEKEGLVGERGGPLLSTARKARIKSPVSKSDAAEAAAAAGSVEEERRRAELLASAAKLMASRVTAADLELPRFASFRARRAELNALAEEKSASLRRTFKIKRRRRRRRDQLLGARRTAVAGNGVPGAAPAPCPALELPDDPDQRVARRLELALETARSRAEDSDGGASGEGGSGSAGPEAHDLFTRFLPPVFQAAKPRHLAS